MKRFTLLEIGIALFVGALPFVMSRHLFYGAINAKYFYTIAGITLCVLLFSYLIYTKKRTLSFQGRYLLWGLGTLLGVHYIASFVGIYPAGALWSDIIRNSGVFFVTYVAFFAVFLSEICTVRGWMLIRRTLASVGALLAFLTIFGTLGIGATGRLFTINFEVSGLTVGNTTFLGAFLILTFLLALIEYTRVENGIRIRRVFGSVALIHLISPVLLFADVWGGGWSGIASILGEARASSATLILIILYLISHFVLTKIVPADIQKRSIQILNGLWLMGIIGAVALLFISGSPIQERYIEESTAARVIVWESGLTAWAERPLLGWGPENYHIAHQRHFDNRLYDQANIGEVWFDRAHNVVVDTLVSVGIVGVLFVVLVVVLFMRAVYRGKQVGIIGTSEATLLYIVPIAHILQLQTSFDTIVTYIVGCVFVGYALWLERESAPQDDHTQSLSPGTHKITAGILVVVVLIGAQYALFAEYHRQQALFNIFTAQDPDQQSTHITEALAGPVRFEPLRLASASFIKGVFEQIEESGGDVVGVSSAVNDQFSLYEAEYKRYIDHIPEDYRAHMNYAYLLMTMSTIGGQNRLDDALTVLENAEHLSETNPLAHILMALTLLYQGDFDAAQEAIAEAEMRNPDIEVTQRVKDHIETQIENAPYITILKLENL